MARLHASVIAMALAVPLLTGCFGKSEDVPDPETFTPPMGTATTQREAPPPTGSPVGGWFEARSRQPTDIEVKQLAGGDGPYQLGNIEISIDGRPCVVGTSPQSNGVLDHPDGDGLWGWQESVVFDRDCTGSLWDQSAEFVSRSSHVVKVVQDGRVALDDIVQVS